MGVLLFFDKKYGGWVEGGREMQWGRGRDGGGIKGRGQPEEFKWEIMQFGGVAYEFFGVDCHRNVSRVFTLRWHVTSGYVQSGSGLSSLKPR